ncbi:MAG: hypothetical protein M3464_14350 [Chloroflexota bacterium]|nr:hypothetical protein [Chloroflexota bacterium]
MMYEVTFQIGGDEQTDQVDAPDAATAASRVRNAHQTDDGMFELLLVHLVEEDEPGSPEPATEPVLPVSH